RHGGAVVRRDGNIAGSDQIVVARNGRYAFYTNQRDASLGVGRIDRASDGTPSLSIVGHVALDRLPAGIALSADGTMLYVTSEIDNVDPQSVPGASDSRLGRTSCDVNLGPHGVLSVIDTRLAVDDPIHAVRFRIAAGCAPVRVALSSRGDVAWVSVRGEDRVLAFSTSKLMDDNEHALLAQLAVGPEPIGILATHDGAELMVAASDGESQAHRPRRSRLDVFDTAAVLGGGVTAACETSPAGRRPRELYESADGTIWVTDYDGRAVVAFAGETSVATLGRTPSAAIQRSRCST
ncbi:MAG: hypothetical protein IAI50_10280, partial [Candidatus Eremiobacteraeota bacterium]|nr:hypothetical protein [Candidatus Eremiobacteraeota bacterium]